MKVRFAGGFLFAVLLIGPTAVATQERPEIPQALQQTYGAFARAMVQGEADKAAGFYAEDAVVLVDHEHVYRGRTAIREEFLAGYLDNDSRESEEGPGTDIQVDRAVAGEDVVTLAGRYSNPAGAAGIYSNTWERQRDGRWKLAASVMTFQSSGRSASRSGESFSCTQVLGFSQTLEWYAGLSLGGYMRESGPPELPALKRGGFLPGWQGRFIPGGAIEKWKDPDFPGWTGEHDRVRSTPAYCARDEVDRVVFNVSGESRAPAAWAEAVQSVAGVVRVKFPSVRRVVMQPVVGAPEGQCGQVRAAQNHPGIVEGIRRAAGLAGVVAGPGPKVADCDQFRDQFGHLTGEGARHVRRMLREHYD